MASPRLVAWEITSTCNLLCAHCRGSSSEDHCDSELSTAESFSLIDGILQVGKPIIILTGGEPLLRTDFLDIAKYCRERGLRVTVGSNGTLITRQTAARMKEAGIARVGISIDFPSAGLQDSFRGIPGAYDAAVKGAVNAIACGLDVQINTTVTRLNLAHLDDLLLFALELGAVAFHPFMLVPTGRGKALAGQELGPEEYEGVLHWVYDRQVELGDRIFLKPTDAPQYMRVVAQRDGGSQRETRTRGRLDSLTRGCLAGTGFCFISHVGRVQGCGYLDVQAGNVREQAFADIWQNSPLFTQLRDYQMIKGKCGVCEYTAVCGGCRARAYEHTGDYLAEEPDCIYQPAARSRPGQSGAV
jgi:heme b synthase